MAIQVPSAHADALPVWLTPRPAAQLAVSLSGSSPTGRAGPPGPAGVKIADTLSRRSTASFKSLHAAELQLAGAVTGNEMAA